MTLSELQEMVIRYKAATRKMDDAVKEMFPVGSRWRCWIEGIEVEVKAYCLEVDCVAVQKVGYVGKYHDGPCVNQLWGRIS